MSEQRLPWNDGEKALLRKIYAETPYASLPDITRAFNQRNFRYRSEYALKAKRRVLNLGPQESGNSEDNTMPPPPPLEKPLSVYSDQSLSIPYDWIMRELGIFLPVHPLIEEARRHAACSFMPGYSREPISKWPSILAKVDFSVLKCAEEDKVALKNYLEYAEMWRSRSSSKHTYGAHRK